MMESSVLGRDSPLSIKANLSMIEGLNTQNRPATTIGNSMRKANTSAYQSLNQTVVDQSYMRNTSTNRDAS
jgi:hypothetical protein